MNERKSQKNSDGAEQTGAVEAAPVNPSSGAGTANPAAKRYGSGSSSGGHTSSQGGSSGRATFASLMGAGTTTPATHSLPSDMQSGMEAALGLNLDQVRVETNQPSVDDARAKAATRGTAIQFAVGQYQPNTASGRQLIRHEVAHVAQNLNTGGKAGSQGDREAEAAAFASGTATSVALAGTSAAQFDIKSDLRDAMSGWGTDESAIYGRLGRASAAELSAVINDSGLMSELRSELNDSELKRVLGLLNAPLPHKLRLAMRGWGTDEEYIMNSLRAAPAAQLQAVVNDSTLMGQLRGELSDSDMRQVLRLLNAPVPVVLRMAVQGWGTDDELVFETLSSASPAELQAVLADQPLMDALRSDFSQGDMERVLDLLNAPLADKLKLAMDGWGTDEQYIFNSIAAASAADRQAVGGDTALMEKLQGELSRELYLRAISELGVVIPLADRLRMALDGWGVEREYLFQQIALASNAEKLAILGDATLMAQLKSELSGDDFTALLQGLDAPLEDRLRAACEGWGTDERYIYDTIAAASDAEKRAILANNGLMELLKGELTETETHRLLNNLNAPLAVKIEFALSGWFASADFIREALAQATPADKATLQANAALMARLTAELSEEELRAALGTTPEIEAHRLFQQGNFIAAFNLLTVDPAQTQAKLDAFEALGSVSDLLDTLPKGQACPNDVREDLTTLINNDGVLSRVAKAFDIRWDMDSGTKTKKIDTDGDGTPDTDMTPSWTVARYRRVHAILLTMPDSHVLSGLIDDIVIFGSTNASRSAYWGNRPIVGGEIGVSEGSFGSNATGTPWQTTYGDAANPAAARQVDWLGAAMRHEVGHNVDDMLGSRTNSLKEGLGGWWSGKSIDEWLDGMPNPFGTSTGVVIPDNERQQIKDHIADYLGTSCTAPLNDGLDPAHPINTYWGLNVPIIQAARHTQGLGKSFWTNPGTIQQYGGQYYTLNPYYHKFQRYNTQVHTNRVRNYSIFSPEEFFAELYTVYYETGNTPGSNPGQHIPVASWREWFDRNVHAAGRSPDAVAGNSQQNQ
ncbi:MAG: DUF4157 domain-containing protein [Proteobacteria bacterium]|nr:DUF4157 domain-containing protein [Pseudomonadota bacterium]